MLIIKKVMSDKKITQSVLAEKLGISVTALNKQIKGNPTIETLNKIATALNVEVRDLFSYDKSKEPIHLIIKGELKSFETFDELKQFVNQ